MMHMRKKQRYQNVFQNEATNQTRLNVHCMYLQRQDKDRSREFCIPIYKSFYLRWNPKFLSLFVSKSVGFMMSSMSSDSRNILEKMVNDIRLRDLSSSKM